MINASNPSGTIKVLSIDGGGIRGIIPAIILDALQKQIGADLHTVFDLSPARPPAESSLSASARHPRTASRTLPPSS